MFKFDDFLARAKSRLLTEAPVDWNHSDNDLNEMAPMISAGIVPKPAAVLIGIVEREEPMVILTRRQDHLANHAGQIAFPGGRVDRGETIIDAALREAEEEIFLERRFVTPLGYADGFLTITHYRVMPIVALINPDCSMQAHAGEVSEIFEVPLAFLMNVTNCKIESQKFRGITRQFYAYPFRDKYIWGATAGMIKNLYERLYA